MIKYYNLLFKGVPLLKKKLLQGIFLLPYTLLAEDLSQLLELSLKNQLIESTNYNIKSLESKYKSVQNSYMPKVTIGATFSNTNQETITTPNNSLVSYANINYIVYDGGAKKNRYKSFEESIKSSKENLNSLKNNISLNVINYYFSYLSLISSKQAKEQELNTLKAQQSRLTKFLEAGTTTSDEVDKITARVQNSKVLLDELELKLQTILHNLEYITGKKVSIINGSKVNELDVKQNRLRADIRAMKFEINKLLEDAKIQNSSKYPMINLDNTFYNYNMNYDNKNYEANSVNSQNIFKVNLSWKIFDFDTTKKSYESAYLQYQSLKSKYDYEKNKASIDLKLALKAYDIAKLKIKSEELALKAANSAYGTIENKYQNGLVNNVAYLEALTEKYSAISSLKKSKYDLEIKKANIIYYSGKNLWEFIK